VVAWLSHRLLHVPLGTIVSVFRVVQWLIFLVVIITRYSDMEITSSTQDVGTLALHVPLPQWWGLLARILGLLPLLTGYIAINTLMFHLMPHDLPQLAELSPQRALFRATGPILWGAVILNVFIVRTRLAGVSLPSWRTRFLQQHSKLHVSLSSGLHFMASLTLFLPYSMLVSAFLEVLRDSGFPVPLQALIAATVGLLLTLVNGYLLEHYIPQIEPWG